MHEMTTEAIKESSALSNRDVDLTSAASSSEAAGASSEHERASIDHGKEASSGDKLYAADSTDRAQGSSVKVNASWLRKPLEVECVKTFSLLCSE